MATYNIKETAIMFFTKEKGCDLHEECKSNRRNKITVNKNIVLKVCVEFGKDWDLLKQAIGRKKQTNDRN